MSLINDALKKAQKQREGQTGLPVSPPSLRDVPIPAVPKASRSPSAVVVGITVSLGLILLLTLGAGAAYLIFQWRPTGESAPPALAQTSGETANEPSRNGEMTSPPTLDPVPASQPTPVTPAPAPAPAPVPTPATQAAAATTPAPTAPAQSPRVPLVERNPEVEQYLRRVNISAREAGPDSRVAIDGTVFFLGDVVMPEFGLRLTGVTTNRIVFQDEAGAIYYRRL